MAETRYRRSLYLVALMLLVVIGAVFGILAGAGVFSRGNDNNLDESASSKDSNEGEAQQQQGGGGGGIDSTGGENEKNDALDDGIEPSEIPSIEPSPPPSAIPSVTDSVDPSSMPSVFPSFLPTLEPTTASPTFPYPSRAPSVGPSPAPSSAPSAAMDRYRTTFCAIADVPYSPQEKVILEWQIQNLPPECEFLVHLGDIKGASTDCSRSAYVEFDGVMNQSAIPSFILIGDNEWNDCPHGKEDQGYALFHEYFQSYETRHWDADDMYDIVRHPKQKLNFAFVHKRTLFVGLNLVGGVVYPNEDEWNERLNDNLEWTQSLLLEHLPADADGVVVFGHAASSSIQWPFFRAFRLFLRDVIEEKYPVLYLHGDGHLWRDTYQYGNLDRYHRIQLEGGNAPVLVMTVDTHNHNDTRRAFAYDRRLEETTTISTSEAIVTNSDLERSRRRRRTHRGRR